MSSPASRALPIVLRRALAAPAGMVRLLVGEYAAPGADPRYATVLIDGEPISVPKPPAELEGTAAYVLAAPGRLLTLGSGGTPGPAGPAGAAGPAGPAGPAGATGPSTFLSGTGAPTAGVGVDGAFYLDRASLRLWGPKAAGAWPAQPIGRLMPLAPTYGQLTSG